jgi:hypothetical protein
MSKATLWVVTIIFWLLVLLCLACIPVCIISGNQNREKTKQMQREFESQYPVGALVQHKLNTTTGVIVGYNEAMLKVRFPSEYAGVQIAVECLPFELTIMSKNLMDEKVEKEQ